MARGQLAYLVTLPDDNPNDFGRQWKIVEAQVLAAVQRVGGGGHYFLRPEVEQFEIQQTPGAWRGQSWFYRGLKNYGQLYDHLSLPIRFFTKDEVAAILVACQAFQA